MNICHNCKNCKKETFADKCKLHWTQDYITGDYIYEDCIFYNDNGYCKEYEQKPSNIERIKHLITWIKKKIIEIIP